MSADIKQTPISSRAPVSQTGQRVSPAATTMASVVAQSVPVLFNATVADLALPFMTRPKFCATLVVSPEAVGSVLPTHIFELLSASSWIEPVS